MLALQLLTLTFTRTAELINATWGEFDLDNALWVIPAARMKMKRDHEVPLSHQALGVLAELKTLAGAPAHDAMVGRPPGFAGGEGGSTRQRSVGLDCRIDHI